MLHISLSLSPPTSNTVISYKFTVESSPPHEVCGGTRTGYLEHSRPKSLSTELIIFREVESFVPLKTSKYNQIIILLTG